MTNKRMTVSQMGRLGGKARAESLTPERRSEIARTAVQAREVKRKQAQREARRAE